MINYDKNLYIRCPYCKRTLMFLRLTKNKSFLLNCRLCGAVTFVNSRFGKESVLEQLHNLNPDEKKKIKEWLNI